MYIVLAHMECIGIPYKKQKENNRQREQGQRKGGDIHFCVLWILGQLAVEYLEGCCLSNLWEAITYTVLHKDKHTQGQAYRHTLTYLHVHAPQVRFNNGKCSWYTSCYYQTQRKASSFTPRTLQETNSDILSKFNTNRLSSNLICKQQIKREKRRNTTKIKQKTLRSKGYCFSEPNIFLTH